MANDRKRKYYASSQGQSKRRKIGYAGDGSLAVNMKGFFITTALGRERLSANEVCSMIEEDIATNYADCCEEQIEPKETVEQSVEAELEAARTGLKPLSSIGIGADCMMFLALSDKLKERIEPAKVVTRIFEKLIAEKLVPTRYTQRIVPIDTICEASYQAILKNVERIAGNELGSKKSFAVYAKIRSCSHIDKDELVEKIAEQFIAKEHSVNLSVPEISIVVEVIKNLCAIGIVTDSTFIRMRKFNFHEVYENGVSDLEKRKEERLAYIEAKKAQ